jgi:hypothetical protein
VMAGGPRFMEVKRQPLIPEPRFMEVKRRATCPSTPVHGGQKANPVQRHPGSWRSKGSGWQLKPRFMEVKRHEPRHAAPVHGGQKARVSGRRPGSWRPKGMRCISNRSSWRSKGCRERPWLRFV